MSPPQQLLLLPVFPAPSCFGNKLKCLITAASIAPSYITYMSEMDEILVRSLPQIHPNVILMGLFTWRLLVLKEEEHLLDESFTDSLGAPELNPNLDPAISLTRIIDGKYNKIPAPIRERILRTLATLPFTSSFPLRNPQPGQRILGVSIRTWKAFSTDADGIQRTYSADAYKSAIARVIQEHPEINTLFLSIDNPEYLHEYVGVEGRLQRVEFQTPFDLTDFQLSYVKCRWLSHAEIMIGHPMSTFIEMAWWFGGAKATFIAV